MLNIDFWIERAKTDSLAQIIKGVQEDALVSARIIAMEKWRKNSNGEWRAACISIIKGIKILEGQEEENNEDT